jgi:hypothetical protein
MARRRRWPDGAEIQRRDAITAIRDARDQHRAIRTLTDRLDELLRRTLNEPLAHMMTADIRSACSDAGEALADAERLLVLAKLGEKEED